MVAWRPRMSAGAADATIAGVIGGQLQRLQYAAGNNSHDQLHSARTGSVNTASNQDRLLHRATNDTPVKTTQQNLGAMTLSPSSHTISLPSAYKSDVPRGRRALQLLIAHPVTLATGPTDFHGVVHCNPHPKENPGQPQLCPGFINCPDCGKSDCHCPTHASGAGLDGCASWAPMNSNCSTICGKCEDVCRMACFDQSLLTNIAVCCDCSKECRTQGWHVWCSVAILFYVLLMLAKGKWRYFPIGRTMGAMFGAVAVVVTGSLSVNSLGYAGVIDLNTIATLFGLTILCGYLSKFGLTDLLVFLLSKKGLSPKLLLLRVCGVTMVLSAFVTNDAAVIFLTEPIVQVTKDMKVDPEPFLLALATSANIGSALTLVGNPQNILIAMYSGIPFCQFIVLMAPVVLIAELLNYFFLLAFYWKRLRLVGVGCNTNRSEMRGSNSEMRDPLLLDDDGSHTVRARSGSNGGEPEAQAPRPHFNPDMSRVFDPNIFDPDASNMAQSSSNMAQSFNTQVATAAAQESDHEHGKITHGRSMASILRASLLDLAETRPGHAHGSSPSERTSAQQLFGGITCVAMLAGFVFWHSIAWTVLCVVAALTLIEVYIFGGEGTAVLKHVDGSLLVMIASLFMVTGAVQQTGKPDELWKYFGGTLGGNVRDVYFNSEGHAMATSAVILTMSNLCSNVPTVMLLARSFTTTYVDLSKERGIDETVAWLLLSWTSTAAGNFTLMGSISNLIVAERSAKAGKEMSFWMHFKFGSWSTLLVTGSGTLCMLWIVKPMTQAVMNGVNF